MRTLWPCPGKRKRRVYARQPTKFKIAYKLRQAPPVKVWTDHMIDPGRRWAEEIQKAIDRSRIAILVLTADFLASSFIREAELPPILEAAEAAGATILCVYGSDVHLSGVAKRLLQYQFVNDPERSLQSLSEPDRESVYRRLAQIIEKTLLE